MLNITFKNIFCFAGVACLSLVSLCVCKNCNNKFQHRLVFFLRVLNLMVAFTIFFNPSRLLHKNTVQCSQNHRCAAGRIKLLWHPKRCRCLCICRFAVVLICEMPSTSADRPRHRSCESEAQNPPTFSLRGGFYMCLPGNEARLTEPQDNWINCSVPPSLRSTASHAELTFWAQMANLSAEDRPCLKTLLRLEPSG